MVFPDHSHLLFSVAVISLSNVAQIVYGGFAINLVFNAVLSVLSSISVISLKKRELIAFL